MKTTHEIHRCRDAVDKAQRFPSIATSEQSLGIAALDHGHGLAAELPETDASLILSDWGVAVENILQVLADEEAVLYDVVCHLSVQLLRPSGLGISLHAAVALPTDADPHALIVAAAGEEIGRVPGMSQGVESQLEPVQLEL